MTIGLLISFCFNIVLLIAALFCNTLRREAEAKAHDAKKRATTFRIGWTQEQEKFYSLLEHLRALTVMGEHDDL